MNATMVEGGQEFVAHGYELDNEYDNSWDIARYHSRTVRGGPGAISGHGRELLIPLNSRLCVYDAREMNARKFMPAQEIAVPCLTFQEEQIRTVIRPTLRWFTRTSQTERWCGTGARACLCTPSISSSKTPVIP